MKILHAADLHLNTQEKDKQLPVLEELMELATQNQVDLILFAGDLFDNNHEADMLRVEVRRILERADIPILLLPGNHDEESYSATKDYGKSTLLPKGELDIYRHLREYPVVSIPFRTGKGFADHRAELKKLKGDFVLLCHGTFYNRSWRADIQKEKEEVGEYFPIYPEELEGLPIKYLALGHFHQKFYSGSDPIPYCYPGSAYPTSKREVGRRSAALVELTSERTSVEPISLKRPPYYELKEFWCLVGKESMVSDQLEEFLKTLQPPALPSVVVEGFSKDERGFRKELEGLLTSYSYPTNLLSFNVKGIERLAQNQFYTKFGSRIEEEIVKDPGSEKILKLALEIFTEGFSKYLDQQHR